MLQCRSQRQSSTILTILCIITLHFIYEIFKSNRNRFWFYAVFRIRLYESEIEMVSLAQLEETSRQSRVCSLCVY